MITLKNLDVAYLNGGFVHMAEAVLPVTDPGVLFGDSVCEATRTFGGKPFKIKEHMLRLYDSMKAVDIEPPFSIEEMQRLSIEVLERNIDQLEPLQDVWINHTVTRGNGEHGFVIIWCHVIPFSDFAHQYRLGAHMIVSTVRQIPSQCLDSKIKHRSRLHFQLARQEVSSINPEAYPLLLDLEGNIAEGDGCNFFVLSNGELLTPTTRNCLAGVTRATTIEIADSMGIKTREMDIQPFHAYTGDEAFLTTTSRCLLPVTRLNTSRIGAGRPGPISKQLLDAWSKFVCFDISKQIAVHDVGKDVKKIP